MLTTGRWKLGLALSLITALMWGVLPVILKSLLAAMDAPTITWYRFLVSALVLGFFLMQRRRLPALAALAGKGWLLLAIAIVGLLANYLLYLYGLDLVTPATSQMVIQLAPVFLLLGGLVFFAESFAWIQWLGLAVLMGGLLLFFNDRVDQLVSGQGGYYFGVLIIVVAAVAWAAYALAQKRLHRRLKSDQILLLIYIAAVFLLLPLVAPRAVTGLDATQLALLGFACLNTLIAYGAFAEAMVHWEASRVSAVLAVTPLLTLLFSWMTTRWFLSLKVEEHVNLLSVLGACLVVVGSAVTALGRKSRKRSGSIPAPME